MPAPHRPGIQAISAQQPGGQLAELPPFLTGDNDGTTRPRPAVQGIEGDLFSTRDDARVGYGICGIAQVEYRGRIGAV
ncbi:hypothetical protein JANAI61_08010 [Jannaschia sp. AI_61]|nr:hypothetical protein JANAI61_08010 [Jannaschia sp. AI_61]